MNEPNESAIANAGFVVGEDATAVIASVINRPLWHAAAIAIAVLVWAPGVGYA